MFKTFKYNIDFGT